MVAFTCSLSADAPSLWQGQRVIIIAQETVISAAMQDPVSPQPDLRTHPLKVPSKCHEASSTMLVREAKGHNDVYDKIIECSRYLVDVSCGFGLIQDTSDHRNVREQRCLLLLQPSPLFLQDTIHTPFSRVLLRTVHARKSNSLNHSFTSSCCKVRMQTSCK